MDDRINFLVLSDLHISANKLIEQRIVLDALYDDLRVIKDSDIKPDYVVFAGDLVNDPDDADSYLIFLNDFYLPLLTVLSLDETKSFLIPGNHDVSRSSISKYDLETQSILQNYSDSSFINDIYHKRRSSEFIQERQYGFHSTLGALFGERASANEPFISRYDLPTARVTLPGINTAAFSMAGLHGIEKSRLPFPDQALNAELASIPRTQTLICIHHHPLDWLTEGAEREIRTSITQRSIFNAYGHLHAPYPSFVRAPDNSNASAQLPALFSSRASLNGYSIISISRPDNHIKMTFRTYFDNRRKFDKGINVASNGIFYPTDAGESHFSMVDRQLSYEAVRTWISKNVEPHLSAPLNDCSADRPLSTLFVEPPLFEIVPLKDISAETDIVESERRISIDDIVRNARNFAIFVPAEYGRTSLAKRIAASTLALSETLSGTMPRVPVVIDLQETTICEANIFRKIKDWLPDTGTLGYTCQSLVDQGLVTFVFDNVIHNDERTLDVLSDFRKAYPRCQYILLFVAPFAIGAAQALQLPHDSDLQRIEVRTLTRSHVRRLVDNWRLDNTYDTNLMVDQITARFSLLSIPLTPVNVTIFLTVVESIKGFTPINTSSLVENYIDVILEKYDLKAMLRGNFDYRDKVDYLAHVARYMVEKNTYTISHEIVYEISQAYFNIRLLSQKPDQTIAYFIGAKIFNLIGNEIQFRLSIFQSYFIAQAMVLDDKFKKYVLSEYASFGAEIDIYCGIKRDDIGLLMELSDQFISATDKVFTQIPAIPRVGELDQFSLQTDETATAMLRRITKSAFNKKMPQHKKDSLLDKADSSRNDDVQQKLARPQVRSDLARWVMALRAYSYALKNLEFVEGKEKQRHLGIVLEGWAQGLVFGIFLLRHLLERSELEISGTKLKSGIELKEEDAAAVRYLFLILPTFISYYLRNDLGTEKLDLALRAEQGTKPKSVEFMRACLFLDLRLSDYPTMVSRFVRAIRKNQFFIEAMIVKLRDFYLRNSLDDHEDTKMRGVLGDLFGLLPVDDRRGKGSNLTSARLLGVRRKKIVQRIKDSLSDSIAR